MLMTKETCYEAGKEDIYFLVSSVRIESVLNRRETEGAGRGRGGGKIKGCEIKTFNKLNG